MLPGTFSYRFSGAAVDGNDEQYHLIGLGIMHLHQNGTLTGTQSSSITKLVGAGCKLIHTKPTLSGKYHFGADGMGSAKIKFTSAHETLEGTFDFVAVGGDERFWMISTGAKILSQEGILADEVVSGEAVRMPAPPDDR